MSYVYLASPYSGSERQMLVRYAHAKAATAELLRRRIWTYSPIVHCHVLAHDFAMPTDAQFWQAYNFAMLRGARELWILALEGWSYSRGVMGERAEAKRLGLPVALVQRCDPETLDLAYIWCGRRRGTQQLVA